RVLSYANKLVRCTVASILAGGTLVNRSDYLKAVRECQSFSNKFFVFGSGVLNPTFWHGDETRLQEWKNVLENCDYIGVRGPLSANLLLGEGVKDVTVVGDPGLIFAADSPQKTCVLRNKTIGINIGWDHAGQWGEPNKIYEEVCGLAKKASKRGWKVEWFVLCPSDLELTKIIAQQSNTNDIIHEEFSNPKRFIELVQNLSVFVGTRLHSVVFSTCAYVPSVMLEYRPKCRDYMMSINQEKNTIRTDCIDCDIIWEIVNNLNDNHSVFSEQLFISVSHLRNKQKHLAEYVTSNILGE
ncbi:polysaccharide pyruvyl transferase family protein, partial [Candidatus Pacearchaeota archaeon]|nr:polysaccharide pyruvyl transferase family protein [Candidatus Pacearchaeota archaeon]